MRPRALLALLLASGAFAWSACKVDLDGTIGTPTPLLLDAGDGHDGPLTVAGAMVVNECHPASGTAGAAALASSGAGFVEGRRLLVVQTQQSVSDPAVPDANPFSLPAAVGQWEIRRITGVASAGTGLSITLDAPLATLYVTSGGTSAQACTVPEYTDVDVPAGAQLAAAPWDGARGGVVAFMASGTVTLEGNVTASGRGHLGGKVPAGLISAATDVIAPTTWLAGVGLRADGAGKGEGIDGRARDAEGRGNFANGGGGGNGRNGGGGGGGNLGSGGIGGKQSTAVGDNPATAGLGGSALTAPAGVLLLGGGGGGGQHNELAVAPSPGGAGGGIVLVIASHFEGSGSIAARGADGSPSGDGTLADGAGGGGAGGTILVTILTSSFAGTLDASGGKGGDVVLAAGVLGPGGGGGGGRIEAPGLSTASSAATGGAAGTNTGAADANGATAGTP